MTTDAALITTLQSLWVTTPAPAANTGNQLTTVVGSPAKSETIVSLPPENADGIPDLAFADSPAADDGLLEAVGYFGKLADRPVQEIPVDCPHCGSPEEDHVFRTGADGGLFSRCTSCACTWRWGDPSEIVLPPSRDCTDDQRGAYCRRQTGAYFGKLASDVLTDSPSHGANISARWGDPCRRCGSKFGVVTLIHDGSSIRSDCGSCGVFLDFPVWGDADAAAKSMADARAAFSIRCTGRIAS